VNRRFPTALSAVLKDEGGYVNQVLDAVKQKAGRRPKIVPKP
jgi:hypothetical protein